jgi:hypothetical protein
VRSALLGTASTSRRESMTKVTLAVMPGRSQLVVVGDDHGVVGDHVGHRLRLQAHLLDLAGEGPPGR